MSAYASVFRPGLLDDQVVLVTGGGSGIGRCLAHELTALGAAVVVSGRREEPLRATVAEIEDAGGVASAIPFDVRDNDAVEAAVATVLERHGRLDALVNNAGGQFPSPAEAISPNGWRAVIDVNLTGSFLLSRAAFTAAFKQHGGAIVNVVADMWTGFPGMAHTGAARAGVVNLTMTLAREWAPSGVRVNAVAPGIVYSSGMATYPDAVLDVIAQQGRRVPAGRVGTESEVSAAVTFLLSPAAAFITGETIKVDGGGSLDKQPLLRLETVEPFAAFDGFHLARTIPRAWSGERTDDGFDGDKKN